MRTGGRDWLHLRQGGRVSFTHKLSESKEETATPSGRAIVPYITPQERKAKTNGFNPQGGVTSRMPKQTLLAAPFKAILRGIRSAKSVKQRQR